MQSALKEDIYQRMVGIVVEALRVPAASVTWDANLFYDLGAESIDMLDIRFRIQEEYLIQVDREELIRSIGEGLTNDELARRFTVEALVRYVDQKLEALEPLR